MQNRLEFSVWGREALFTDPLTRVGGEKCSYHVPTYEALKGVAKSIFWKPTFIWIIDRIRVLHPFRTRTRGMKPLAYEASGNSLANYTYLVDVAYEVRAHFEWNEHRPELEQDRIDGKHYAMARRSLEKGGRQDIFLGTRECQAYVAPCEYGAGESAFASLDELSFGLMFHGFDYPDETGEEMLRARFWQTVMRHGEIVFPRPEDCRIVKDIHPMRPRVFGLGSSVQPVTAMEVE